ncbi:hypothetical protein PFAG_02338 [Plasmodium falciparum Santa Lucia]|uniref:Uncharacterized protein n=1 Tax=Plasmodium falciparum Santa Lucia TaxID=478859 RepID=W7G6U0_PLAFA|nr:hypothetical protein PFAG_02338 [Plasmodium falciparum Santa Lucia]
MYNLSIVKGIEKQFLYVLKRYLFIYDCISKRINIKNIPYKNYQKILYVNSFLQRVFEKIYIFKYGLYIKIFFKKNVIIFKKYILHFIFIYSIGKINKNKDNI